MRNVLGDLPLQAYSRRLMWLQPASRAEAVCVHASVHVCEPLISHGCNKRFHLLTAQLPPASPPLHPCQCTRHPPFLPNSA
jgi:hypothetical protein